MQIGVSSTCLGVLRFLIASTVLIGLVSSGMSVVILVRLVIIIFTRLRRPYYIKTPLRVTTETNRYSQLLQKKY